MPVFYKGAGSRINKTSCCWKQDGEASKMEIAESALNHSAAGEPVGYFLKVENSDLQWN